MKLPPGKLIVTAVAILALAYGIAEFRGPNGYSELLRRREQTTQLEEQNRKMREDLDRLDKRIDKLRKDPAAQELEVRKRLKMVKPGETVYLLQNKPAQASKPLQSR